MDKSGESAGQMNGHALLLGPKPQRRADAWHRLKTSPWAGGQERKHRPASDAGPEDLEGCHRCCCL